MTPRQMLGLVALSLLASAAWLVDDLLPVEGTPLAGEGLRLLLCSGLTLGLLAGRRSRAVEGSAGRYLKTAVVSLGLVAVPYVLLTAARGRIASTNGVVIFALMPVATMLMMSWLGTAQNGLGSLPSALSGVAGVMILLPVRIPAGGDGLLGVGLLVAAMLLSAGSIVWLHALLRGLTLRAAVPLICLLNGLVLTVASRLTESASWGIMMILPHSLRAVLFDLPQIVLLIWLMKRVSPQRLAGRYLAAPLFTVVEGLFLVRPHLDGRTCSGLGLLAWGAGLAIFGRETNEPDDLRLNLPSAGRAGRPHSGGDGRS